MALTFDYEKWEEFVRVWQTSNSLDEVAKRLNIERAKLSPKANALRKLGVELKRISGRSKKLSSAEVAKLKTLARTALHSGTIVQSSLRRD